MEQFTLRTARDRAGYTMIEASLLLDVSVHTLSNYETGKTLPKVSTLMKMMKLYDVSYDQLIFLSTKNGKNGQKV